MHIQTLVAMAALLGVFVSGVLGVVWHFNRAIPGLKLFALAFPCTGLYSVSLLVRAMFPQAPVVLLGQLGIALAAWLCWQATRQYVGRYTLPLRTGVMAFALLTAMVLYMALVQRTPWASFVTLSLFMGCCYLLAAFTLLRHCPRRRPARWWLGLLLLAHGLFTLLRPTLFDIDDAQVNPIEVLKVGSAAAQFIVIEAALALVLLGMAVLMLINETTTRQLRLLADVDPLTNVANRRALLVQLDQAIKRSIAIGKPLSVLVVDLDHFKSINDTWGHRGGDDALRHFALLAGSCLRKGDGLGRLGGEEFAIVLPDASSDGALLVAERLRAIVYDHPLRGDEGKVIALTVSVGVSERSAHDTPESLLQRADEAMYLAKQRGRNRVEITVAESQNQQPALA